MDSCENLPSGSGQSLVIPETERFKLFQSVYNTITGKSEKLSKVYSKDFKLEREQLNQLHLKCSQILGQWEVMQSNTSLTIQHVDDQKATFSSYERSSVYDGSRTSAVESVIYGLNFLLKQPNVSEPQSYRLSVQILSRVAAEKKLEGLPVPGPMLRLFSRGPIVAEIEYVDYIIANTVLSTVDSWVNEIDLAKDRKVIFFCQRWSHWIPPVAVLLAISSCLAVALREAAVFTSASNPPTAIVQYLIFSLVGIWIVGFVADIIAKIIEGNVDCIVPLSYIRLNKGDEKLIAAHENQKKFRIFKVVLGTLGLVLEYTIVRLFSESLFNWIKPHI